MLKAKDYRNEAWLKISGKWGTLALIYFLSELIIGGCAALSWLGVGVVAAIIVTGPLMLSLSKIALKVVRVQNFQIENIFDGFNYLANSIILWVINNIFIFLWSLLLVIPGIVKAYSYSMSYYILADNPNMPANEARKLSMVMMEGNKWRLFCLHLSFIGWFILCCLTFGILTFWVSPYVQTAEAAFYQSLLDTAPVLAAPADGVEPVFGDMDASEESKDSPEEH
jgi:uncharacterized membrane protein